MHTPVGVDPTIVKASVNRAQPVRCALPSNTMKTRQSTFTRSVRLFFAAAGIFISAIAAQSALAQGDLPYANNTLPPFGGSFRGATPGVFPVPGAGTVQIGIGAYGRDVANAPTESQLRTGGVFPQTGTVDGAIQLSAAQQPVKFSAPTTLVLRSISSPLPQPIPIEILQMNLQGGSLPAGVMLRESPTRASQGSATFQNAAGGYMISSFFDVFFEISLDGGQSWTPAPQTVRLNLVQSVPEHFFPTECFPFGGDYETARNTVTSFANGIAIKNVRHRPNALRSAMPEPGQQQQVRQLGGAMELDISQDGGISFQHFYAVIFEDCIVSSWSVSSGGDRPMESLSLNFTVNPGPPNLMIRESPTLPSLGRTTSRAVPGGYMVGSFFDIFTEVSLDGGQSWTPANGAMHMYLLPYIEAENIYRSNFVLPRDGSLETWPQAEPVRFPNGMRCRNIRFQDFADSEYPPDPGITRLMEEEGIFYYELSSDGGQTWVQHNAPANGVARVSGVIPGPPNLYDTEMLSLNISGGTLPAGLMLRESPTKASHGRLAISSHPRIGQEVIVDFQMDSFFDIFTELSLDGGATWVPALNAARLHLRAQPREVFHRSDWLPLAVQYRESDFEFAAHYGGGNAAGGGGAAIRGIIVQGQSGIIVQGRAPAPAPGSVLTRSMNVPMELQLSLDGGSTFIPCGGQALFTITFSDLLVESVQFTLKTEVVQLDLSGGTLPPDVMLRESPTRASIGRTSIRSVPGGYRISSFFDIFTELSLDGGRTWTPSCDVLHIAAEETAPERAFATNLMPPNGVLENPPGDLALGYPKGEHIKQAVFTCRGAGGGVPPPAPGETARVAADGTAEFLFSTDGGHSFNPIRCMAYYRYELKNVIVTSLTTLYDTEMLQLELWGGNLPAGTMLRESPTRASTGRTSIRQAANGAFLIGSFFDVFMEVSRDGGGTWTPFDLPMHYVLGFEKTFIGASDTWPPRGNFRVPPGDPDFDLLFVGGARMSFFDVFYGNPAPGTPLPEPGISFTRSWEAQCRYTLFLPDGTPVRSTSNASLTARITGGLGTGGTRFFDTEMLQLDIAGGGLPPGVMLRESPTRQSPGKTNVRTVAGGFTVDSFFDIFTEISFDGGQTWSPSDRPVRIEFAAAEIVVEHPIGTELTDGQNLVFPPVLTGASTSKAFTIRNIGAADLTDLTITFTGPDAGSYSVTALPTAPVSGGAATTFVVRLSSATAGAKLATMHIASNDTDENPFDIILTGRVLTPNGDDDGDGIPNGAELNLADCDFNPLVNDTQHILTLRNNGFYQASDMQSLALGGPVLTRDPANGHFHLSVGILKSPNLMNFTPLLNFTPTFNPATGRLDCDIAPDGSNAQFYRVLGTAP